jgi:hypothetical protein
MVIGLGGGVRASTWYCRVLVKEKRKFRIQESMG